MSSILDALKRMEEEEKSAGNVSFSGVGPGKKMRLGRLIPFLVVFAAGVGLAAAGFYLAYGPESPVVAESAAPATTSVFRVVAPTPSSNIKPSGTQPVPRPTQQVAASPAASHESAPNHDSAPASHTELAITQGLASPPAQSPQAQPQPADSSQGAPEASPDELRNLPAADALAYRLQGIRWSQTPSRRIAVINSQIMREGATVDGARVLSITKEGVVLEVAGMRMFLAFVGR